VLSLTLAMAGYRGLLYSNTQYNYYSPGVILPGEPTNIFEIHDGLVMNRFHADEISHKERAQLVEEFARRKNQQYLLLDEYRGQGFSMNVPGGTRT
jgi:hypothetical protein